MINQFPGTSITLFVSGVTEGITNTLRQQLVKVKS